MNAALDVCELDASDLRYPAGLFFVTPPTLPSTDVTTQMFYHGVDFSSDRLNRQSPSFGLFMPVMLQTYAAGNDTAFMEHLRQRFRPYVMMGGYVQWVSGPTPYFKTVGASYPAVSAALVAGSAYSDYTLDFVPSTAEMIHSLSSYAATTAFGDAPLVARIVSDDAVLYELAVRSLHTFQVDPVGGSSTLREGTVDEALQWAIAAATSGKNVVLMACVANETLASVFALRVAAALSAVSSTVAQRIVILAPWSEQVMYAVKTGAAGSAMPTTARLVFASFMPAWWDVSSSLGQQLVSVMQTSDPLIVQHPSAVRGHLLMRFIETVTQSFGRTNGSASYFVSAVYNAVTVNAGDVTFGPFHRANCSAMELGAASPARVCQCQRAIHTYWAHDLMDWVGASNGRTGLFQYSLAGCGGVVYGPLIVPATLNVGMVAGIAVPLGACLVAAIALFVACTGRNNRAAPKDPSVPFAIVFTDIQSSTSLWGRCPQEMGDCVDRHHEEIRKLIRRYEGYEVKTVGDCFMVAFKKARNAAEFSLSIQTTFFELEWPPEVDDTYRDLAMEKAMEDAEAAQAKGWVSPQSPDRPQWDDDATYALNWNGIRVRVGLNWGTGSVKLDPVSQGYDYYGTLVNTAARVEGVGNGGQVLVTKDFFDELERSGFDMRSIDVVPLGPQPLRGLDAPVPLYQLNPPHLKTRQFAALRLDVEVGLDEEEISENPTGDNASSAHSEMFASPEVLAERLLKKTRVLGKGGLTVDFVVRVARVFQMCLSTSPMSWQQTTLKHLMKKWHVHARSNSKKEEVDVMDFVSLICRVGVAVEEALGHHLARGASRRLSCVMDQVSSVMSGSSNSRGVVKV